MPLSPQPVTVCGSSRRMLRERKREREREREREKMTAEEEAVEALYLGAHFTD